MDPVRINSSTAYTLPNAPSRLISKVPGVVNPLNAELNPICHLLPLLGGATIVVVSRLRVKTPECHDTIAEKRVTKILKSFAIIAGPIIRICAFCCLY
jgi:hypothetical protein